MPSAAALEKIPVGCGRCPYCKKRRVNQWVFRLMEEEKVSSSAHFVTLTYNTDHVPISDHGFMTLRPSDLTLYWKRLRKLTHNKIKYYAVGEYGTDNKRPHYHAIVFNVPDPEMFFKAWQIDGKSLGNVHVGKVTTSSVAYTMKYIDKPGTIGKFGRDDRIPEFSRQSNGLGKSYITEATKKFHTDDLSRMYVTKLSGHKVAIPKYYREKIIKCPVQKSTQLSIVRRNIEERQRYMAIQHSTLQSKNRIPADITLLEWEGNKNRVEYKNFYHRQQKRKL